MSDPRYGKRVRLEMPSEQAIEAVTAALQAEGFGVLTRIDVDKTLKEKLDIDRAPYVILGACNPRLANSALGIEPEVGLLLPCNVVVYEDGERTGVVVSIVDPNLAMSVSGNDALKPIASEAATLLACVLDRLTQRE